MIHAEVVLQGDGGEGLCGSFHLDVLFGLDSLVQSVRPAAALHDTTRLLVHNLHLAVDDHVLIVLIEHAVGLEQLLQGVYALRLHGIVSHQLVLLVNTLLIVERRIALEGRQLACDIGQHKQLGIVDLFGQPARTFVGKVAGVQLLVDDEIQGLHALRHAAVVVLHIDFLSLQHAGLDAFLRQVLDERLVLGHGLVRAIERQETFL